MGLQSDVTLQHPLPTTSHFTVYTENIATLYIILGLLTVAFDCVNKMFSPLCLLSSAGVYRCWISVCSQERPDTSCSWLPLSQILFECLCGVSPLSVTAALSGPKDTALPAGVPLLRVGPVLRQFTVMGIKDVLPHLKVCLTQTFAEKYFKLCARTLCDYAAVLIWNNSEFIRRSAFHLSSFSRFDDLLAWTLVFNTPQIVNRI